MARKARRTSTVRKKTTPKKASRIAAKGGAGRRGAARPARTRPAPDALLAGIPGAERREVGRVVLDIVRAGDARVKREIYPPGFRWSRDMKPVTGTDLCMHAHVGFLARGRIHIEYADGCVVEFKAPQVVAIEPGHEGWVVGSQAAVLIEFDFERDTIRRLGMPERHTHA